jgi:hypothetical protein
MNIIKTNFSELVQINEARKIVIELSERLADDSDYETYLMPKLEQVMQVLNPKFINKCKKEK